MIPEQRLRELVDGYHGGLRDEVRGMAAELLAARAELLAAREEIDDLRVSNSNLIAEALKHDTLRQERDAASAENERLAKQRDEKRERLRKVVEMVAEASDLMDGDKADREHAEQLLADAISYGMSTSPRAIAAEQPKPAGSGA